MLCILFWILCRSAGRLSVSRVGKCVDAAHADSSVGRIEHTSLFLCAGQVGSIANEVSMQAHDWHVLNKAHKAKDVMQDIPRQFGLQTPRNQEQRPHSRLCCHIKE